MKTLSLRLLLVGLGLVMVPTLAAAPVLTARVQTPTPQTAQRAQKLKDALVPPEPGAYRAPNGRWAMHADQASRLTSPDKLAPLTAGGPDDYGYTWNDAANYYWIDATAGTNTGLSHEGIGGFSPAVTDAIDLGFSFKFYQNAYSQLFVSSAGVVGFDHDSLFYNGTGYIPNPSSTNDYIAPYYDSPLSVNYGGHNGQVYYLRGGTAPNRYFVTEWYNVDDGSNTLTFQVVLNESGNIDFNYQNMNQPNGYWCGTSAGIENATGQDGLAYKQESCNWMSQSTGHTVHFTRPAASAKVGASPKKGGAFGYPALPAVFVETIINNGDFGTDTYELSITPNWPVTLYESDGVTPLENTNGIAGIDTGPIPQGSTKDIVVKVTVPAGATVEQSYNVQLTISSTLNSSQKKVISLAIAIPVPFLQAFNSSSYRRLKYIRQWGEVDIKRTGDYSCCLDGAVTTAPDGSVIQVWPAMRQNSNNYWVAELYYAIYNKIGAVTRVATRVTDNDAATTYAYDYNPAVAAAPDGSISIAWRREMYDTSNSPGNFNIYQLVLDSSGDKIAFINLTNNSSWNTSSSNLSFDDARVVATQNNRYVTSWEAVSSGNDNTPTATPARTNTPVPPAPTITPRPTPAPLISQASRDKEIPNGSFWQSTVWYAVHDTLGNAVHAASLFSNDTCSANGWTDNGLALVPLADNNIFVVQRYCGGIGIGRLDSSGNILNTLSTYNSTFITSPTAVQLANGNIVMAWHQQTSTHWVIGYAVLNSSLATVKEVTTLAGTSPINDGNPSITRSGDRAVLTWSGVDDPHLYYALLDNSGNLVTQPTIFASGNTFYSTGWIYYDGLANTWLPDDVTPPTNPTVLSSSSHTPGVWSNINVVTVNWSGAADAESGVDGYSYVWDHNTQTLPGTTNTVEQTISSTTSSALADGNWYFHLRTRDNAGNSTVDALHTGPYKVDTTPPTSAAWVPMFTTGPFSITWRGMDGSSGIAAYDVWVRDGLAGAWVKWQANTKATNATYLAGAIGHTYYIRSSATDVAGNSEAATQLPLDGDANTTVAALQVSGRVFNSRNEPIFNATVTSDPPALNVAASDGQGNYTLFYIPSGLYTLTAQNSSYGLVSPLIDLNISDNLTGVDFVLPPLDQVVSNGTFESGNLGAWGSESGISATVATDAANTGMYGLLLEAEPVVNLSERSPVRGVSAGQPCITQTVVISAGWQQPTLSFMYRVLDGVPADSLVVSVISTGGVVSQSIPMSPNGWLHVWMDLGGLQGQTVDVCIGFATQDQPQTVYLDNVSVGDNQPGVTLLYLPVLMLGNVAYAGTNFVVNTLTDTNDGTCNLANCTLRDAINAANTNVGPTTITFSVSGIITLTATLPAINNEITIDGTGHAITVSGNSAVQVMSVNVSKTLQLQSITIADGSASNGGGIGNGGTLTVINSTFSSNNAYYGAGIDNAGTLTVTNSTFMGNSSTGFGGGIANRQTMNMTNSSFTGNSAVFGGGIFNPGTLTVTNSTFSGNSARGFGGGIANMMFGMLTVTNSTFSSNSADYGGGIDNNGTLTEINNTSSGNSPSGSGGGGGIYNGSALTVINSTFSGNNTSDNGGGIDNTGTLTVTNSIIANSTAGGDCWGSATGSHNLIKDATNACGLINGTDGNIIGVDPLIGPLVNNGGSTLTYALLAGSPAINAGNNVACPPLDQRGVTRPQGVICDIGAVEYPFPFRVNLPMVQK